MTTWTKNGNICKDGILHCKDGRTIINAHPTQWIEEGWEEYIPPQPSAEKIAKQEALAEIEKLQENLDKTDFIGHKEIEGYDCDTLYSNWKANRRAWRDRINELEEMYNLKSEAQL